MIKKETRASSFADKDVQDLLDPGEWLLRLRDGVDWEPLERKLEKLYSPDTGRPACPPLALFRVTHLQRWYNHSDPAMARQLRYNLLFQAFAGLSVVDARLDDTTIALFRKRLSAAGLEEWAFRHFLKQMEKRGLVVKEVTLVDATLVEAAVNRDAKDRDGNPQDGDAEWGGKEDKKVFGYKAHAAVDGGSHLIREVKVTDASVHDSQMLEKVCPEDTKSVYADKAYDSKERRRVLKARGMAARVLFSARRNRPLTKRQEKLNAAWSRVRGKVEAAFCSLKRWCGMQRIRYLGMDGARMQVYFAALAHNLKRMMKLAEAGAGVCE